MQASHCGGFSCCGAWVLGYAGFSTCSTMGSVVVVLEAQALGLVDPRLVRSFRIKDGTVSPALASRFFTSELPGKTWLAFLEALLNTWFDVSY